MFTIAIACDVDVLALAPPSLDQNLHLRGEYASQLSEANLAREVLVECILKGKRKGTALLTREMCSGIWGGVRD